MNKFDQEDFKSILDLRFIFVFTLFFIVFLNIFSNLQ